MELKQKLSLCGQIITREKIISLMEIIQQYTDERQILNIKFSDDSEYANLSIDEFKEICFDNKLIEKMNIYVFSSYKYEWRNKFSFTYYRTDFDSDMEYSSNNRDQFLHIQDDVEKWETSVTSRKWISIFYKWYFNVFIFFILSFSFATITYKIISEASIDVIVKLTLILLPIIFNVIALPIVALFRKSFPKVELDLGVNKSKKLRKILWIVLTLIIIPIIISIFI